MASITITLPDEMFDEVLDAHASATGYSENSGLSKEEALENTLIEVCRSYVRVARAENARAVEHQAVNDSIPLKQAAKPEGRVE